MPLSQTTQHVSIMCTAQSLPADILCELYSLLSIAWPVSPFAGSPLERIAWLSLTHVCHHWREVAIAWSPSYWAGMATDFVYAGAGGSTSLDVLVARARDQPLTIRMVPPQFSGMYNWQKDQYLHLIALAARRLRDDCVRSLHERLYTDVWWVNRLPGKRFCALESLILEYRTTSHRRLQTQVRFLREVARSPAVDVPNLRKLELNGFFIPVLAPSLTHLKIDLASPSCTSVVSLSAVLGLLQQAVNLRVLDITTAHALLENGLDNDVEILLPLPKLDTVRLTGSSVVVEQLWRSIGQPLDATLALSVAMWEADMPSSPSSSSSSLPSSSSSSSSSSDSGDSDSDTSDTDSTISTESTISSPHIIDFNLFYPLLTAFDSKLRHPGHERLTLRGLTYNKNEVYDPFTMPSLETCGTMFVFSNVPPTLHQGSFDRDALEKSGSTCLSVEHGSSYSIPVVHCIARLLDHADIPVTTLDMSYASPVLINGVRAVFSHVQTLRLDISDMLPLGSSSFYWHLPSLDTIELVCRHGHLILRLPDCKLAWEVTTLMLKTLAQHGIRVRKLVILDDDKTYWDSFRKMAGPADKEGLSEARLWVDELDDRRAPFAV
ncbi:hypothetical protein PENSPDRAFT_352913 [Peniophora sp. CONT]|nr:hypothetical protein PENSPDRAFT_352913 [Peniophora sp. CONT]